MLCIQGGCVRACRYSATHSNLRCDKGTSPEGNGEKPENIRDSSPPSTERGMKFMELMNECLTPKLNKKFGFWVSANGKLKANMYI